VLVMIVHMNDDFLRIGLIGVRRDWRLQGCGVGCFAICVRSRSCFTRPGKIAQYVVESRA